MQIWKKFVLTKEQKNALLEAEKSTSNAKILKKIQCIRLKDLWRNHDQVAHFLSVSDQTISNWMQTYYEKWIKWLLERNYEWKVSSLTKKQLNELVRKNKKKPFANAKEIQHYIAEKYWFHYHLHRVQKMVKKNFDCHTKKPN